MAKLHNLNEKSYKNRCLKFFIHRKVSGIKEKASCYVRDKQEEYSHKFEEPHRSFFLRSVPPTQHPVAQSLEALRCKPEARRFDSRRCHWYFSLT